MSPFSIACSIVKKLSQAGFIAYFAGGWVRDYLMEHPSDDIDIATSASTDDLDALFDKTLPVGIHFGIMIVVEQGHHYEVATFRKDQGYLDGRRPIGIEKACPKEDALRRDFTINGMFYDPMSDKLYDYVEGKKDLKKGVIRAIGNPHERFLEDRLRMIRAVRYASRFNFLIESHTLQAIVDHADSLFPAVALERVWNEFLKMAAFPNFHQALIMMHRLHLLPCIFRELKQVTIEEIQKRVQHLPLFPKKAPVIAKILELFPFSSLEKQLSICDYFKLSNQERAFVKDAYHIKASFQKSLSPYEWAHLYALPLFSTHLAIYALHLPSDQKKGVLKQHLERQKTLEKAIERIQKKRPFLRSQDLKKEGIPSNKTMGLLLKEGEEIAINHSLEDSQEILKKLKQSKNWP